MQSHLQGERKFKVIRASYSLKIPEYTSPFLANSCYSTLYTRRAKKCCFSFHRWFTSSHTRHLLSIYFPTLQSSFHRCYCILGNPFATSLWASSCPRYHSRGRPCSSQGYYWRSRRGQGTTQHVRWDTTRKAGDSWCYPAERVECRDESYLGDITGCWHVAARFLQGVRGSMFPSIVAHHTNTFAVHAMFQWHSPLGIIH